MFGPQDIKSSTIFAQNILKNIKDRILMQSKEKSFLLCSGSCIGRDPIKDIHL